MENVGTFANLVICQARTVVFLQWRYYQTFRIPYTLKVRCVWPFFLQANTDEFTHFTEHFYYWLQKILSLTLNWTGRTRLRFCSEWNLFTRELLWQCVHGVWLLNGEICHEPVRRISSQTGETVELDCLMMCLLYLTYPWLPRLGFGNGLSDLWGY